MSIDCLCCCLQVNSSISRSLLLHIQITSTYFLPFCWNVDGVSKWCLIASWRWFEVSCWLALIECLGLVLFWCFCPHGVFSCFFCFIWLFFFIGKNRQKDLLHYRQYKRLILIIFNTLYFRLVCKKYRSKQRNPKREKTLHFYPSDLLNFFFG